MYTAKEFQPLTRALPADQCVYKVMLQELEHALEQSKANMRGYMLIRNEQVVAEKLWKPYEAADKVGLYSISKSFTSTAIGLAVAEGVLDIEDLVSSFFPDKCPDASSENLQHMKIRHLLTMTTGHDKDTSIPVMSAPDGDWIKAFLAQPVVHPPGTHFLYNSGASFLLSAILQIVTKETLEEYLGPRLFEPLGFDDVLWDKNPQGINTGGWGIRIRLEDMAKLGQVYLNKGVYQGKRILSEEWVAQATTRQADNSQTENRFADWNQGYGFQFWCCRHDAFRADGAAGQYCVVMPKQNAVLVIMSEVLNMQDILDLVWDILLPGLENTDSPLEKTVSGRNYRIEENGMGLKTACITISQKEMELRFVGADTVFTFHAGRGDWISGKTILPFGLPVIIPDSAMKGDLHAVSAYFKWKDKHTLEINWVYRDTPHRDRLVICFEGEKASFQCPPSPAGEYLGMKATQFDGTAE